MQTLTADKNSKNYEVYPSPAIVESVKLALVTRRGKLQYSTEPVIAKAFALNAEESLRQLMVKAVPGLRESTLSIAHVTDMMNWIKDITHAVSVEDFRMIDSLNLVYECWPESWEEDRRTEFLKYYAYALDCMISKL